MPEPRSLVFYQPVPSPSKPCNTLGVPLAWLALAERGGRLTRREFARAWLDHIHRSDDAQGWCRWNLCRRVPPAAAGTFENPFASDTGALARAEIWALLFPGDPASAGGYAFLDASLDHGPEGVAGAVFLAVLLSHVAAGDSLREAVGFALANVPSESETGRALEMAVDYHRLGVPADDARKDLLAYHGSDNDRHGPLNVGLAAWALLYGGGEFEESLLLAANGGRDPETVAAAVGAVLGALRGASGIPARWKEPIGRRLALGLGIVGVDAPPDFHELTRRTVALKGKLERKEWSDLDWEGHAALPPDLAKLPGTIRLAAFAGAKPVPWANGELPAAAKAGGGAEWEWRKADAGRRRVICLAPGGARLLIDGRVAVDCPPGFPYVPEPFRCAPVARAWVELPAGSHRVRVELGAADARQSAAVVLVYPNGHLAPWTDDALPDPAVLAEAGQ